MTASSTTVRGQTAGETQAVPMPRPVATSRARRTRRPRPAPSEVARRVEIPPGAAPSRRRSTGEIAATAFGAPLLAFPVTLLVTVLGPAPTIALYATLVFAPILWPAFPHASRTVVASVMSAGTAVMVGGRWVITRRRVRRPQEEGVLATGARPQ